MKIETMDYNFGHDLVFIDRSYNRRCKNCNMRIDASFELRHFMLKYYSKQLTSLKLVRILSCAEYKMQQALE